MSSIYSAQASLFQL